jgi:putative FmdB family regulatory protein
MPTYSYFCEHCSVSFELFFYIKDYIENPKCIKCKKHKAIRKFTEDALTQSSSVKKSDTELKTIGDLAQRNSERMSDDEKYSLYLKHNSYKDDDKISKELPKGMSRIKKNQAKIKWPGSQGIKRRTKKNG